MKQKEQTLTHIKERNMEERERQEGERKEERERERKEKEMREQLATQLQGWLDDAREESKELQTDLSRIKRQHKEEEMTQTM